MMCDICDKLIYLIRTDLSYALPFYSVKTLCHHMVINYDNAYDIYGITNFIGNIIYCIKILKNNDKYVIKSYKFFNIFCHVSINI
jgi:hypothetical protein